MHRLVVFFSSGTQEYIGLTSSAKGLNIYWFNNLFSLISTPSWKTKYNTPSKLRTIEPHLWALFKFFKSLYKLLILHFNTNSSITSNTVIVITNIVLYSEMFARIRVEPISYFPLCNWTLLVPATFVMLWHFAHRIYYFSIHIYDVHKGLWICVALKPSLYIS